MALPKVDFLEFLKENQGYTILELRSGRYILKLANGDIVKVLEEELLEELAETGYDLEARLGEVENLTKFKNFPWATKMLEADGIVNGYVMPNVPGVALLSYHGSGLDLAKYADIHSQIEQNIKDGHEVGIVFPDLYATPNIRITPEGKVFFIDFEGLEIKHMPSVGYSCFLGSPEEVLTPKYYDSETGLLSPEIDIKSSIFSYFLDVFSVSLESVNRKDQVTHRVTTLDDIFSLINLDDPDIQQKVWKLFQESTPNEFLGDHLYRMAEKYRLVKHPDRALTKMLVKR